MWTKLPRIAMGALLALACAFAQTTMSVQSFPLHDASGLVMVGKVKAEETDYQGRKAIHLVYDGYNNGFALLPGTDFQDGVIEADIALKVTTPPGVRNPGFIGIAFRAKPDASHYELFYLRPGNAEAADQAMRNHAVQYVSPPDFDWYALRREWPWVYESHADLKPETWTKLKIEVAGRTAKLYVNGSSSPALIVDGLKGEDLHGAVALWGYPNEEAYFSNVRITPSEPQNVTNGSDIAGTWDVRYSSDAGVLNGSLKVSRTADKVTGVWTGGLGQNCPVTGTWRNGYVELSFPGEWPKDAGIGKPGPVTAFLAGWIDGNSGKGRMRVEQHSDGQWTATRTQTPTAAPPQEDAKATKSLDAEYRKLDELASFLRTRNTKEFAINTEKGINEASYVHVGGIDQWVTIRGQDRANPVLLFLHGGPGDVTNPWSFVIFADWERHFTVVQWDQRGAGRTLRKTGPSVAPTLTLDRMAQDGIELSEYLRKHLGKEKIVVVAHSFGTIIGLRMVRTRPDLFYAYVGTGEVADETRNWSVAYDELFKKAQATGNQEAINELKSVGPPPYPSRAGYQVQRKWSNMFEGADQFIYGTLGLTLVAPGNSVEDINDDGDGQLLSGERLVSLTTSATSADLGLEFAVPIFFFQGTEDFTSPTELARQYLISIKAPHKEFVPINGGHFAVFINSDQFLKELVARVSPLAGG